MAKWILTGCGAPQAFKTKQEAEQFRDDLISRANDTLTNDGTEFQQELSQEIVDATFTIAKVD